MPRRVDPDRQAGQAPIAQPELMFLAGAFSAIRVSRDGAAAIRSPMLRFSER